MLSGLSVFPDCHQIHPMPPSGVFFPFPNDYILINDDLNIAVEKFHSIVVAESQKISRNKYRPSKKLFIFGLSKFIRHYAKTVEVKTEQN